MSEPIVYIDRSDIREGRSEEVKVAARELVEFIREREPQLLAYGFHFDEDDTRMTVIAIHPDAASLKLHLEIGSKAFRRFAELIDLRTIEVFGDPGDSVLGRLREKAADLGDGGSVVVHRQQAGFARLRLSQER